MPTNFITLPRSALYDLVWSKPVRDVAYDFGISDVALATRCREQLFINLGTPPPGTAPRRTRFRPVCRSGACPAPEPGTQSVGDTFDASRSPSSWRGLLCMCDMYVSG
jgi:hypothetical protein